MLDTVFDIINVFTAIVTVASIIVKYTPTKEDDKFVAKLMPFVAALSFKKD